MKRIRLYVVMDVEEDLPTAEVSGHVAEVRDGIVGTPLFVGAVDGYEDEFREYGADPSSWDSDSGEEHDCEARDPKNPCDLCKRRKALEGIFVCGKDAEGKPQTLCSFCLATHPEIDIGSDAVDVWEVGSDGWVSVPVCDDCEEEIDVVIGTETEELHS